ncbi:MAG: hypothetical protein NT040_16705, partial [Bacteroidetes bacterium]|nr:hypothetical protein [Bacteroidota bacterium]
MKKRLLFFLLICIVGRLSSQTTVTIGTGTATQKQPFGMFYGYERSAAVYTGAFGYITSLGWYVGTSDAVSCPVKIYLKTTSSTTLTASTWATMISGATLVYNGTLSFSSTGWQTIDIADFASTNSSLMVLCESNFGGIGATTYPVFCYSIATNTHEYWQDDIPPTGTGTRTQNRPNIQITYIALGTPVPPSGFMAVPAGSSQVNLSWKKNLGGNDVMVACNTTNSFGVPSGSYVAGSAITGGGTVIYNGSATSFSHTGLSPAMTYYYMAWSVLPPVPAYSTGTGASASTLCAITSIFPSVTGFETSSFPPVCWSLAGLPWGRSGSASGYGSGTASAKADFLNQVAGSCDLVSPELNLAALTDPVVKFDHAYATYAAQVDKLELWYSVNNGTTYTLLNTWLGGLGGPLNTGGAVTTPFVPTAAQWATKTFALPSATNRVMFRGVSLNGNNLYLDNITFLGTCLPASIPTAVITPGGPTAFCQGGSVNLVASGGTSYVWSTAATSSAIGVNAGGIYTVTVTNASGCSDTESVSVTVTPGPTAAIAAGGPSTFCQGGHVILTASGGTGYTWSNAATSAAITVSAGGTYTVTTTNTNGCTDTKSLLVTVNSLPTAGITPNGPVTFCQGGSVMLTASGGTGYLWSNAVTAASITVSTGGTYTVTATNTNGCTDTESILVTVNSLPTAAITPGGPVTFCQGGSVILTATGGTGYIWSNAATTAAINVSAGGIYTVTATNASGCTDTENILVTVNSLPIAAITPGGPTTFCQGSSVILTATGGAGYVWSNAATTAAINVSAGGTYTVTATNANGCTDTENILVTVNSLPTAAITPGGPVTFCQGGSVMLTATGGAGYVWSNASTNEAITVSIGGTYTVTATNTNGCTDTENILVTVNSLPSAAITPGGPVTFCQGGSVMLTASGGTGYLWSNAVTAASITVSTGGTYTVTATNTNGCTDSENILVTVNSLPTAIITPGGPVTFCQGGSVMLTATGGTGYAWSNAATSAAITVSAGGTYTVTATN